MKRYLVRVEAPATWTVEVHAEDEDAATIGAGELVESAAGTPGGNEAARFVIDWGEVNFTLDEVEG